MTVEFPALLSAATALELHDLRVAISADCLDDLSDDTIDQATRSLQELQRTTTPGTALETEIAQFFERLDI